MAGSGAPCPEPSGLKGCRPVSSAGCELPAASPLLARLSQAKIEESIPMSNAEHEAGASAPANDDLYFKTGILPETLFQMLGRLKREAFEEIERLLSFVDEFDGDADLEPSGDELDASYPEGGAHLCAGNEDDEDGADDEPSLGSVETPNYFTGAKRRGQDFWASGNGDEREGDGCADDREDVSEDEGAQCDDSGKSEDYEPSLGSLDQHMSQLGWGKQWNDGSDREAADDAAMVE